ncbi:MAG: TonB-dependent receptor [Microscillaceae bacterium]|nr:TonB-dependent receptor [Microscillaceae bacterium]
MQGLDAAYTMILIDGQPMVGRQAGTLDLSRLTVHNIERIEIIKGASSSLYGSEALAGVVNIITREAEKDGKWQGQAGYRLASFGTHDASATLQYNKGIVSLDVFANYFASRGYSLAEAARLPTVEPFHNFTFQPKIKISPSEKLSLMIHSRFYGQDQDYRAFINEALFAGKSLSREWNQTLLVRQTLRKNWKMEYDLYATHYRFDEGLRDAGQVLFEENLYRQWFYRPEIRTHYKMGHNTLTAGVGMNYENPAAYPF